MSIQNNTTELQAILDAVNSLPEAGGGGITPDGTIEITENGTYDVTAYATAQVSVHTGGDDGDFVDLLEGDIREIASEKITKVKQYTCYGSNSLLSVDLPNVTTIGLYAFYSCANLVTVKMASLLTVNNYAFQNCTDLVTADFASATKINNAALQGCSSLTALILRANSICSLVAATVLNNTPIKSGTGYIYVPRSRVGSYKSTTNWSTYANQFRALEDYTVDGTTTGELDETKI